MYATYNMWIYLFILLFSMTNSLAASNIKIIAHRGASNVAPENTIKAFQKAKELNADIIELDVHLSNSNVPIVVHDLLFAKLYPNDGSEHNAETKKLFSVLKGEKIPTLLEVLSTFLDYNFMIEIKHGSASDQSLANEVLKTIKESGHQNFRIGSLSPFILKEVKKEDPNIALIGIVSHENINYLEDFININVEIIAAEFSLVNLEFVSYLHQMNKKIWVWTVDDKKTIKWALKCHVDGLITNNIKLSKAVLN